MRHFPAKIAIISCAGLGNRLGHNIPKCLVTIGEKSLLARQLELLADIDEVRIVVGFKKEDVISEAIKYRRNAKFIHNDNYANSTNAYSLHLASYDLSDPFIIVDGDMLIKRDSFYEFLDSVDESESLIGITSLKTEEPIFAHVNQEKFVYKFNRTELSSYEWCGIAYIKGIQFKSDGGFVCDEIQPHLPLRAYNIDCYEIDTPQDLILASKALMTADDDF